jgi:4-amino-4-deoxy-L-arabinose transferase-like glycosyltransferase
MLGQPLCNLYQRAWLGPATLLAVCALLRVGAVDRQGLWADEVLSLALATGHSLEHPAAMADPTLGDYVESPQALPPSAYRRYLAHERPAAGPGRVVRAVFLSETSPPLYYLLLYAWTLVAGTSDTALHLFSVVWALACLPLLWFLGRQVGGRAASLPVCILFTVSPLSVYYSTEGRAYSLLWFLTLGTMCTTLELHRRGARLGVFLLWVAAGAAGLLTHYFFAFVWAAALAWLLLQRGRFDGRFLALGVVVVGLLILPWYVRVPESLTNWRVAGDAWLKARPAGYNPVLAWLALLWSFLSIRGIWGGAAWCDLINGAVLVALALVAGRKLWRKLCSTRPRLLGYWLLAACSGPLVFDLWRGTYAVSVPRYGLAGLPAALLLVGLALGRLRLLPRTGFLIALVLAELTGVYEVYRCEMRHSEPTRQLGKYLAKASGATDLVIMHSIPSGVLAVARYMDSEGASDKGVGLASWVGQLGRRRVPEDLQMLAAGRKRIIFVKLHALGEPAPEEAWLKENATLALRTPVQTTSVYHFVAGAKEVFAPSAPETGPVR